MTRVISCRVIEPTSHGDGDAETALVPPGAGEQYLASSILPTVDRYVGLPGNRRGYGRGFGVGSYNTTGDIPAGLILDTLA